ncbi:MAG TPA: hypothetical protein VFX30_08175, partial [bacterium]|nr:hypothetical protein [bacterium]
MSISITVRPSGAKTGGTDQTIPGDGDIDTREEAEAALSFLPDGSEDTVVVGKSSYTRDQLIGIRDGAPSPDAEEGETERGEGVSHGAYLQGSGSGGFDDDADPEDPESKNHKGHSGGRVRAGYETSIPFNNDEYKASADLRLGIEVGNSGTEYE